MPTPVVPVVPSRTYSATRKKKVLLYEADDGTRETRVKGSAKQTVEVTCNRRPKSEWTAMKTFWNTNYPGIVVQFTHPDSGVTGDYYLDSDFKEEWHFANLVSFSFVLKEA